MNGIKTIVFDLDGTIYQNNHFHGDYVRFLLEESPLENWHGALVSYIDGVFAGRGLTMNAYYRIKKLECGTPEAFFTALESLRLPDMTFDQAREQADTVFLGDAWAVVCYIGTCLGLLEEGRGDAVYKKTREKMSADGMEGYAPLGETIRALGRKYETVLLTNSYEQTARDFLHQLGFDGIFTKIVFSANKPFGMVNRLREFCPQLETEPETFLTVGDHAFNDLMPLLEKGCKALWINPFPGVNKAKADLTVSTLEELKTCLERMTR